jgi:hypothetical protein
MEFGSLCGVDRNGYKGSEQTGVSSVKSLRGAEAALDTQICLEKRWPLRLTAFPDRFGWGIRRQSGAILNL